MRTRRVDMAELVVEVKVGLEGLEERAFIEATEEHRLVHRDVPLHQRAHRALVRGRAARGDESGAHFHGEILLGTSCGLQPMERFQERLERARRYRLKRVRRLMAGERLEAVALVDAL